MRFTFGAPSVNTYMNNNTNTQNLTGQLNDAVLNGYVRPIEIIKDWMSYRHPEYELNSASLQEGRFNLSGDPAFYLASGDYCGKFEVPNYYERIPCEIKPHTVYVFDAPSFSKDYGYNEAFVQKKENGGWQFCQEVSQYLTDNYSVSGILYQSAALHEEGERGYCIVILPGRDQKIEDDFFIKRNAESGGRSWPIMGQPQLPHHRTCGSASGGSDQAARDKPQPHD